MPAGKTFGLLARGLMRGLSRQLRDGTMSDPLELRQGDRGRAFHRDVLRAISPRFETADRAPLLELPAHFDFDECVRIIMWHYGEPVDPPEDPEKLMETLCLLRHLDVSFDRSEWEERALRTLTRDTALDMGGLARVIGDMPDLCSVGDAEAAAAIGEMTAPEIDRALGPYKHAPEVIERACCEHNLDLRKLTELLALWQGAPEPRRRDLGRWLGRLDRNVFAGRLRLPAPFPRLAPPKTESAFLCTSQPRPLETDFHLCRWEGGSSVLATEPDNRPPDSVAPFITPLCPLVTHVYLLCGIRFFLVDTLERALRPLPCVSGPQKIVSHLDHVFGFGPSEEGTVWRYDTLARKWETSAGILRAGDECQALSLGADEMCVAGVHDRYGPRDRVRRLLRVHFWRPSGFETGKQPRRTMELDIEGCWALRAMLPGPGGRTWLQLRHRSRKNEHAMHSFAEGEGFRAESNENHLLRHSLDNPLVSCERGVIFSEDGWTWSRPGLKNGDSWSPQTGWFRNRVPQHGGPGLPVGIVE